MAAPCWRGMKAAMLASRAARRRRGGPRWLGLLLLLGVPAARGDTLTWVNLAGGQWGVRTNWNPAQVPTAADDVLITLAGTYVITQNVNAAAANLTLGGATGSQTLLANARTLSVAQTLTIAPTGRLSENSSLTSAVVRVAGRLDWVAGTLAGPVNQTGWIEIAPGGGLTMSNNAARNLNRLILTNAGTVLWHSATLRHVGGPAVIGNAPGGWFQVETASSWTATGVTPPVFVNDGILTVGPGTSTLSFAGTFENRGTNILRGLLTLASGSGWYRQTAGRTVLEGGTLRADGGTEIAAGTLEGNGVVDSVVRNAGGLRPGASPGLLHLRRDLVQGSTASLELELGGTADPQFDRLQVDGTATLDGLLGVTFVNGFIPQPNDRFSFLTATRGRAGRFADLIAPPGPPWLEVSELPQGAQLGVIAGPPTLALTLSAASATITAEQLQDLGVLISFPGGSAAGVTLAARTDDPTVLPGANIAFFGTGRSRTMRIRPEVTARGRTLVTVLGAGEGGAAASATLDLTIQPAPPQGMLAYEPFDYAPAGSALVLRNGGFGFSNPWLSSGGFLLDTGSLPYAGMLQAGHHAQINAQSSAQTLTRRLAARLGAPGTVRYVSLLARAEGTLGAGAANGYFGLLLDASVGVDLFLGKPGSGDTHRWVLQDAGGANQQSSLRDVVSGNATWLVAKLEFSPGNDRVSLFVDPIPGQPEPPRPDAVREDRDLGDIVSLALTSTGAWAVDELRIGTSWASATPDHNYLAPLALQPVEDQAAAEDTLLQLATPLATVVTPRQPVFEIVAGPPGMTMDPATGTISWIPGEASGGTTNAVTVRVHDLPEPPSRQSEVTFNVVVQEMNSPPELALDPGAVLVAAPAAPFSLQLGATDNDVPTNDVVFAKTPNTGPAGLTVSPSGLVAWTPAANEPLGWVSVYVDLTDSNPQAPAADQHLTRHTHFDVLVVTPRSDLSMQLLSSPVAVSEGQTGELVFQIENRGPSIARQAEFSFQSPQLAANPPRLAVVSVRNDHGSFQLQGDHVRCDLGDLAVGARAGVTLELQFAAEDTVSFITSARSALPDDNLSNSSQAGTVTVVARPPDNPVQWQFTHVEDLGEVGHGACLATDRRGMPHALWFDQSHAQLHYGSWNGLDWEVRVVHGVFNPGSDVSATVFLDLATPLSIAVDEQFRLHAAASIRRDNGSRALVYLTASADDALEGSWNVESVFEGLAYSPVIAVSTGTQPSRRIWFVGDHRLYVTTRGTSATPSWPLGQIVLPDGWRAAQNGTTIAPVSSTEAFIAAVSPSDGSVQLLFYPGRAVSLGDEQVDALAPTETSKVHLAAQRIGGFPTAVYTHVVPSGDRTEIRYVQRAGRSPLPEVIPAPPYCGRPALTVNAQGEPVVAFNCAEQSADDPALDNQDRFFRRKWFVAHPEGAQWASEPIYETEEVTPGLSVEQKHRRLDYPVDPSLVLGSANDGSLMILLHTDWPNQNLVFGMLSPRWTTFPPVASFDQGVAALPVVALDAYAYPHVAWSDVSQTGTTRLNHKWLRPGPAFDQAAPQNLSGVIHRDGLLDDGTDHFDGLLSDPFGNQPVAAVATDAGGGPWVDAPLPGALRAAADGTVGVLALNRTTSSGLLERQMLAVGFDDRHRPLAFQSYAGAPWVPLSVPNAVSPDANSAPLSAAYAVAQPRAFPPLAFLAYVVSDGADYHIRLARLNESVWRRDEPLLTITDSQPPLMDLEWLDHPPYDDPGNLGYLYLAYTIPDSNGQRRVALARLHLTTAADTTWEFIPLANLAPDYVQSLRLQGRQESLRLAAFAPRRAYMVSAEKILDANNVNRAAVERLPVAGRASDVDLAMTGARLWLAYQEDASRIRLMTTGGPTTFAPQERPAAQSPIPPTFPAPVECAKGDTECACYTLTVLTLAGLPAARNLQDPSSRVALAGGSAPEIGIPSLAEAMPRLYRLRDLMDLTPEGRRLVELYYRHEWRARQVANHHPLLYARSFDLFSNFLPGLFAWLDGRGAEVTISRGMIEQLNSVWDTLVALGDPELRAALRTERARFHGFEDFVDRNMDDWAGLLQLISTASSSLQIIQSARSDQGFSVTLVPRTREAYLLLRKSSLDDPVWAPVTNATQQVIGSQLVLDDPTPPADHAFYQVQATAPGTWR